MASFTKGMRFVLKCLWKLFSVLLIALVVIMTVVMFLQITMRTLGMQSFKWSEEVLRYMYIWIVFIGLPVAIYSNDLTRFDLIQRRLSPMGVKILETVLIAVMMLILFFMVQGAFTLIKFQMRQMMTSLNIPMGIIYLCLPISGIASLLFFAAKLFLLWTKQPDLDDTPALQAQEEVQGK